MTTALELRPGTDASALDRVVGARAAREAPAVGNEPLSEEPTMSPFILIELARTIEADRRRESRIAIARRRMRSGAPSPRN